MVKSGDLVLKKEKAFTSASAADMNFSLRAVNMILVVVGLHSIVN